MAAAVRVQFGGSLAGRGAVRDRAALRRLLVRAARSALRAEHVADAEISITLLDDAGIERMNRDYLRHDGVTDVISFALYEGEEAPVGDIYIGYGQALRQADEAGIADEEELARLAIHGVLHVLGHDHPAGRQRLRSPMWRAQEAILSEVLGA